MDFVLHSAHAEGVVNVYNLSAQLYQIFLCNTNNLLGFIQSSQLCRGIWPPPHNKCLGYDTKQI